MPKESDISELLADTPNKKCWRCGRVTGFLEIGGLLILCEDCGKVEAMAESSKELADFDR